MDDFWSLCSRQMDTKKRVDLSSCFLVEASGDSEVGLDPKDLAAAPDDNDDAESCSCDVSDCYYYYSCVGDNTNSGEVEEASVHGVTDHNKEQYQEHEDEDEDEVQSYRTWVDGHINGVQVNKKSCVSVESTSEPMNEKERNRLFWESCLAS
ncbi:uncharacterized protein LOC8287200 [Ricinus communis]|uniref:Uncharacterized protein n=1 Tax=Ricinus communis TaxID=3988 RepID=B9S3Y3_RICCO|nr:uncharacterized protein LOC8287200 [Ricinus communis]EEF41664.1 conserved hypothetical protein [Ricinus communis]|eukprot:XP_002520702.1 uncharacterized protein LOC8287200 [Ricinus communis]